MREKYVFCKCAWVNGCVSPLARLHAVFRSNWRFLVWCCRHRKLRSHRLPQGVSKNLWEDKGLQENVNDCRREHDSLFIIKQKRGRNSHSHTNGHTNTYIHLSDYHSLIVDIWKVHVTITHYTIQPIKENTSSDRTEIKEIKMNT